MTAQAQRIADLERQVAELAAEVGTLRAEAFIVRTIEEIRAGAAAPRMPGPSPRRPRHLSVVAGGRS
jgi:hypothetical protein